MFYDDTLSIGLHNLNQTGIVTIKFHILYQNYYILLPLEVITA